MKELSIEEKARRYDEAIEKLRNLYDNYDTISTLIDIKEELGNIFSELKESEDEKIIKSFIRLLKAFYDVNFPTPEGFERKDMIAWLEKQGEQKPAYKVEPKFKVGDWVVNTITNEVEQVIELTDCEYICSGHLIVSFGNQHILRKWTIQDTFIEKTCKWLTNAFHQNSNGTFNYVGGNECTIKDIVCIFRQGMEE